MSQRNKKETKSTRRSERNYLKSVSEKITRTPVSAIPRNISAKVLSEPKNKLNRAKRIKWHSSRSYSVEIELTAPKPVETKLSERLKKLTLAQLFRRFHQSKVRGDGFRFKRAKLSPHSTAFIAAFTQAAEQQDTIKAAVEKEIARRTLSTIH